ncbi:MAG TPA: hypothetical protein VH165_12230 [Kofleriaceae bacterium]|jgi:outer membrane biosynthesis protein TonB|nr:hypothetical protein [Kofleriaceae bacterium]
MRAPYLAGLPVLGACLLSSAPVAGEPPAAPTGKPAAIPAATAAPAAKPALTPAAPAAPTAKPAPTPAAPAAPTGKPAPTPTTPAAPAAKPAPTPAAPAAPAAKPTPTPAGPAAPTTRPAPAVAAPSSAPAAGAALDLGALARQSKTLDLAEDQLRPALVKGKPDGVAFSSALDLGAGNAAIAWSECSKSGCRGSLALLTGAPDHPRLAKQAPLVAPPKVFFADGFSFDAPSVSDLDGDGVPEIIFHYTATEPPRAALGSLTHEYLAAYSSKDLTLVFSHELRRAGGDSEDACQWTLTLAGPQLTASGQCNTRTCLESASPAPTCKPARKLTELWRKPAKQPRYTRAPGP